MRGKELHVRKRLIFVGKWHVIEPLGILYLLGIAKRLGWEARVVLIDSFDYQPLFREVRDFKPDLVCFSIWTGWHVQTFRACDAVRSLGIKVAIGGPHATYFTDECLAHAEWVVKAEGFRNFRRLLEGQLPYGIHFDTERMAEGFPIPDRELVYQAYPFLARSLIKSIMCTVGCPFHCSYCYAPTYNRLYGGFALNVRPVDDIIREALEIKHRWPAEMIYFQDDIFGYDIPWLREFVHAWKANIGIPWHCQIRLELTRNTERLELFREGGCTGITLAIESGNAFLRQFVLERPMADDLIVEGTRKIMRLGMTLRTEQILAVPFSDIETDLQTLALNNRINPDMAWVSILGPFGGTVMGTIAQNFGFYTGNNDDFSETFFDRSILRHVKDGRTSIEPCVARTLQGPHDNPLLRMRAVPEFGNHARILVRTADGTERPACAFEYLEDWQNSRYCDQTVTLQRIFNWLAKIPQGHRLGTRFVALPSTEWTWETLGSLTREHWNEIGYRDQAASWERRLATEMGYGTPEELPQLVRTNPWYFAFFPGSATFAKHILEADPFTGHEPPRQFDALAPLARYWLFEHGLYRTKPATPPIATQ